jgi:hypothetical protein
LESPELLLGQEQRQQSSAGQPLAQQPTPTSQTQTQKQQDGGTKSVSLEIVVFESEFAM